MDDHFPTESIEFETETDILTLLENVKCQGNNPSGLKQALLALATICSSGAVSQQYFYMAGGVRELKSLLLEGSCSLSTVPAALYCLGCAVRQNVTSQNSVLSEDMLSMIHELLSHTDSCDKLMQAAAFLLACTVAGSSKGQLMASETGCLQDLVQLLRECITSGCDDNKWSVVTRAIGVCVNNPHNAHNQQTCCSVLPHILKFINTEPNHQCVTHAFTLIGLVVASNASNQDRIRRCGGIETLVHFITKQASVECISLSLLANASSAVNSCIADNEESGMQAGKLGLVPVLLDLLQEKDLELSQAQIFILTLAQVLESSNEYCQLVTEGRGYHILINVLTDSQDEELCKVVKYIITLCKNKENVKQKIDNPGGENLGSPKNSTRDLSTFLMEGLAELSGRLNTIEKISENIQWLKSMDTPNVSMNNPKFQKDTPAEISINGIMVSQINMSGETPHRAGNRGVFKESRVDYTPHNHNPHNYFKDGVFQGHQLVPPSHNTHTYHGKSSTTNNISYLKNGNQDKELLLQDSSRDGYVHEDGVSSRLDTSRTIPQRNCAGSGNANFNNNHSKHSIQPGKQTVVTSSSHQPPPQDRNIGNRTTWNDVHNTPLPHYSTAVFKQGLKRHITPSVSSVLSGYRLESARDSNTHLESAENGNSLLDNRSERQTRVSISKQIPNVGFLGQLDSCQANNSKESENQRVQRSQFYKEGASKQYRNEDIESSGQRKTLFSTAQHQQKDEQMLPNDLGSYVHHYGTINEQYRDPSVNYCRRSSTHERKTSSITSEKVDLGCRLRTQTNMDFCRSYDENLLSSPGVSCAGHVTTLNSPSSQLNIQYNSHQAHTASTPRTASLNNGTNHEESVSKSNDPPHENRFHLLAELQKVMSSFFKALIPEQASCIPALLETQSREHSTQLTDPGSLGRPAVEKPDEQDLLHSDLSLNNSPAASTNILTVCKENDMPEEDTHQQFLHTESNSQMFQSEKDKTSKIRDNELPDNLKGTINVAEKPELCNNSGIQTHTSTQEASATCMGDYADGESSKKLVTSIHEYTAFAKPSHIPLHRLHPRKAVRLTPNISRTGTPLSSHISAKAAVNQGPHQLPPSPALSQFDSHLTRMAHFGTSDCSKSASRSATITRKVYRSSRHETNSTSLTNRNVSLAWSLSKRSSTDQVGDYKPLSNQLPSPCAAGSKHPRSVEVEPLPLYRKNVACLSKAQALLGKDKCLLIKEVAETNGHPTKPEKLIEKGYHGVRKDPGSCNPDYSKTPLCPGCTAGLNFNSYTYNIAIETCVHTCTYHRTIRQCEREYIRQKLNSRSSVKGSARDDDKHGSTSLRDVYDYQTDSTEPTSSPTLGAPRLRRTYARQGAVQKQDNRREVRRPRVVYTQQELLNLLDGVAKMGNRWNQILCTYQFHPSRTAVDLKDKYKQLKIKEKQEQQVKAERPFSMCEVRRLKNGVKHLGYNWKAILKSYKFLPSRTAEDLYKQWRYLNQIKVE